MNRATSTTSAALAGGASLAEPSELDELIERLRTVYRVHQVGNARTQELEQRIVSLEGELRDTEQLLIAAERQAARLASLYAASYQLHSLDPAEVRGAIGEIAVDLLGVKRCVLLMASDEDSSGHDVVDLVAGEPAAPPLAPPRYSGGDPLVDDSLADGSIRVGGAPGSQALAVVPLAMQGRTVGALVVLAFLPQKAALRWEDRELLDLLAAHAASALAGAQLFKDTQRKLKTLEGLMALLRRTPGGAR